MVKTGKAAGALAGAAALTFLSACGGGQAPSAPAHRARTVSQVSKQYEQGLKFGQRSGLSGEPLQAGCYATMQVHGYTHSWERGCNAA